MRSEKGKMEKNKCGNKDVFGGFMIKIMGTKQTMILILENLDMKFSSHFQNKVVFNGMGCEPMEIDRVLKQPPPPPPSQKHL